MQLVQLQIALEFDESTQLHTPARKIYDVLAATPPKAKPKEPGTNIRNEKQKLLINWRYERCRVVLERTENRDECVSLMMRLFEAIDSVAAIGKIQDMDVRTSWILPVPRHSFDSLNELYMHTMISQKEFMKGTHDSSIILDGRIDDFLFHHQSGPMEPKQLLETFLVFKRENLPKVFIFLLTSITYKKVIEYSRSEIHRLLMDALHKCERHSEDFGKIWEGKL